MLTKFNLIDKVAECLKEHPEQRFSAGEISLWIFENYPQKCEEKRKKSKQDLKNNQDLINQIAAEIGSSASTGKLQKKFPQIKTVGERPRKYYFTEKSDEEEIIEIENNSKDQSSKKDPTEKTIKEADLYPILIQFLQSENIYSKRINEKISRNSKGPGGNKWLHPDIVGIKNLNEKWEDNIKNCAHYREVMKLYSFEVKKLLNSANVRESFFQTVSNSSWANLAYLVAQEISHNVKDELEMLHGVHGIGIIVLDTENPSESQIILPAKERDKVDWNTLDRLAKEKNEDILKYIKSIKKFIQTKELESPDWDGCKLRYNDNDE